WAPAKSLSNPNIASPIAKPGLSTTYTVQVSTANGCMEEETIDIKVNNPNPPKVEISSNTGSLKLCDGGITLSISGFVSQDWSTGSDNDKIFVRQPGVSSVTAFDANGCAGFASVEIAKLAFIESPEGAVLCPNSPNQKLTLTAPRGM